MQISTYEKINFSTQMAGISKEMSEFEKNLKRNNYNFIDVVICVNGFVNFFLDKYMKYNIEYIKMEQLYRIIKIIPKYFKELNDKIFNEIYENIKLYRSEIYIFIENVGKDPNESAQEYFKRFCEKTKSFNDKLKEIIKKYEGFDEIKNKVLGKLRDFKTCEKGLRRLTQSDCEQFDNIFSENKKKLFEEIEFCDETLIIFIENLSEIKNNIFIELLKGIAQAERKFQYIVNSADYLISKVIYDFSLVSYNVDFIDKDVIEIVKRILSINQNYNYYKNIFYKWIQLVDLFERNMYKNIQLIYEQDEILFKKTSRTFEWIEEYETLTEEWESNVQTCDFFQRLNMLSERLFEEIDNGEINMCCFCQMHFLLIDIIRMYIEIQEYGGKNEIINIELRDKYICLENKFGGNSHNSNNGEQASKTNDTEKKYSLNYFSKLNYMNMLKEGIPFEVLCDNKEFYELLEQRNDNALIEFLINKYRYYNKCHNEEENHDDNIDIDVYMKRKNAETTKILELLLDGDTGFIKIDGDFQFSKHTLELLNDFINGTKNDPDYKCFLSDLKKIIKIKKKTNKENLKDKKNKEKRILSHYENDEFEDFFIPYIHQIIEFLYEVKVPKFYDEEQNDESVKNMHLECTYELLSHFVFNSYINEVLRLKRHLVKRPDQFKSFYQINDEDISKLIKRIDNDIEVTKKSKLCYNKRLLVYDNSLMSLYKLIISRIKKIIADIEG